MQQRTIVLEAHPVGALEDTVLIPLPYVNAVEISEETVTLHAAGEQFLCSRADWDNATIQR